MESGPKNIEVINTKEKLMELEASGEYLFHGSPNKIFSFEPHQAFTDQGGNRVPDGEPAIFTSSEIETPIFRSIFHESQFDGKGGTFSMGFTNGVKPLVNANEATIEVAKNNKGYVYVFYKKDFEPHRDTEWISKKNVTPYAVFYSSFKDIDLHIDIK